MGLRRNGRLLSLRFSGRLLDLGRGDRLIAWPWKKEFAGRIRPHHQPADNAAVSIQIKFDYFLLVSAGRDKVNGGMLASQFEVGQF